MQAACGHGRGDRRLQPAGLSMEVITERAVSLNPVSQDLESRRARQLLPPTTWPRLAPSSVEVEGGFVADGSWPEAWRASGRCPWRRQGRERVVLGGDTVAAACT